MGYMAYVIQLAANNSLKIVYSVNLLSQEHRGQTTNKNILI